MGVKVLSLIQAEDESPSEWEKRVNEWLEAHDGRILQAKVDTEKGRAMLVALYEEITESPGPSVRQPHPPATEETASPPQPPQ